MDVARFNDETWYAEDALAWIFFSGTDMGPGRGKTYRVTLFQQLKRGMKGGRLNLRSLRDVDAAVIDGIAGDLAGLIPELKELASAQPIYWARLALRALALGVKPSNEFLEAWSQWRAERARRRGEEWIVGVPGKGSMRKDKGQAVDLVRYTMDEFLLAPPVANGRWAIVGSAVVTAKVSAQARSARRKTVDPEEGRSIQNIVGATAYRTISEAVADLAARARRQKKLEARRVGPRFAARCSRSEFVEWLMVHSPEIRKYSGATVRRALTDFVAFPNYRRAFVESAGRKPRENDEWRDDDA